MQLELTVYRCGSYEYPRGISDLVTTGRQYEFS